MFGGGTGQGASGHSERTEHAQKDWCRRVFLWKHGFRSLEFHTMGFHGKVHTCSVGPYISQTFCMIIKTKAGHGITTPVPSSLPRDPWLCTKSIACRQCLSGTLDQTIGPHFYPFYDTTWFDPIYFSQKTLGAGVFASSKYCCNSEGEKELSNPFCILEMVRSRCISVYWKNKVSGWEKRKLGLEGESFFYPSLPQKVKDGPAGAISTCFLSSEHLAWMLFTPVSGEGTAEKKEKYPWIFHAVPLLTF